MTITEEAVLKALSHVDDPDLKKDLVTLNMVRNIHIEGKNVSFTVVLTTPACPMKEMIHNACVNAVQLMVDKEAEVEIEMTSEVATNVAEDKGGLSGIKNIIAVASGKGGVGKSTVAANLAVSLARSGASVGLLDADIYGPSVPTLFGLVDERPFMETRDGKDMMIPFDKHGIKVMSIGFLVESGQAIVWRGPMASKALNQLLRDTLWGEIDYLILDLPPGTGDIHITIAQQLPLTGALMVTTPQKVAVADARKAAAMFVAPQINVKVLGFVENMAYFVPEDMPEKKYFIFGQEGGTRLAEEFRSPLLGQIPLVEQVRVSGDEGNPISTDNDNPLSLAFQELAANVAQQVSIHNARVPLSAS